MPCINCGYNLRGLNAGRNCPECGRAIPLDYATAADPLLAGSFERRGWTMWGLTMMFASALAFALLRVACAATWSIAKWPPFEVYAITCMGLGVVWSAGVFLATPRSMDVGRPAWSARWMLRWSSRCTQPFWALSALSGLLALLAGPFTPQQASFANLSLGFTAIAIIGWIVLALLLHQVAEEIDLDDAPRRIGLAIWTVPVLTLVLMFVPLRVFIFVLAFIVPLLLAWAWYLIGFARGVWEMRQYVAWGLRISVDDIDRQRRIAQTRTELEREANLIVRPLTARPHAPPTTPGPIPPRRWH